MTHWSFQPNWQHYPVDASHPYYVMDHNRCILCHRCVRACGQLVGNFTLGIEERGASSMLVADTGLPLGESSCVSCGTCVAVCPTGALIERRSAYQGLADKLTETQSVCVGCSVGCGVTLFTRDNRLVRVLGDWDAPVNGGVLCKEGRFLPLEENRERITNPLIKKNGALQPATWDEALDVLATRLKPLAGKNDNGIAALAATRLPIEALSLFKQVFTDCLGSAMVTSTEEGRPTASVSVLAEELGQPFEADLEALKAADCVLAVGVNLAENHMVAGFLVKRNLPNGTRLVVIDPGANAFDTYANLALKATRGSDQDVLKGIQAGLVKLGLDDSGRAGMTTAEAENELVRAAQATGISAEELLAAAGMLGVAEKPVIVYGKGITSQNTMQSLRQLAALGQQAGAALLSIKGNANSLAAAQLRLDEPFQMKDQQAVFVALGDEYPSQRLIQRLENAPFLAVQASYVSRLSASGRRSSTGRDVDRTGRPFPQPGRPPAENQPRPYRPRPASAQTPRFSKPWPVSLNYKPDENWAASICARPAPVQIHAQAIAASNSGMEKNSY